VTTLARLVARARAETDVDTETARKLGTDRHAQLRTILDELAVIAARLGTD
jgi:hypothetical protein